MSQTTLWQVTKHLKTLIVVGRGARKAENQDQEKRKKSKNRKKAWSEKVTPLYLFEDFPLCSQL